MLKSVGGFENARNPRPITRQTNPIAMNIDNELTPAGNTWIALADSLITASRQSVATNSAVPILLNSFMISPVSSSMFLLIMRVERIDELSNSEQMLPHARTNMFKKI